MAAHDPGATAAALVERLALRGPTAAAKEVPARAR
jgi:hypothetical protein